jgi:hypothetical protein
MEYGGPVGVRYRGDVWTIFPENGVEIPEGTVFDVFVVNRYFSDLPLVRR